MIFGLKILPQQGRLFPADRSLPVALPIAGAGDALSAGPASAAPSFEQGHHDQAQNRAGLFGVFHVSQLM